jgi:hypothetical protein
LEAAKSELERQVAAAERHAREGKRREQELREEVRKHKGRAETNNRVYLVTKGELELLKERLAQAERKLWLAGIPMPTPPQKDRPKASGPAAAGADRAHEAVDTPAPEAGSSAMEGASVTAAGERIAVEEGATELAAAGASPVPPLRRRAENGVEEKKPI